MAEKNKINTQTSASWINNNRIRDLINDVITCERIHLFFNFLPYPAKEVVMHSAIKNKRKSNCFKVSLNALLQKHDPEVEEEVSDYIKFQTNIYHLLDILSIIEKLLNVAIAEACGFKKMLERQFDAQAQVTTTVDEAGKKQNEERKVEENRAVRVSSKSSGDDKNGISLQHNVDVINEVENCQESNSVKVESQALEKESYIKSDNSTTKPLKLKDDNREKETHVDIETFSVKMEKISSPLKETKLPESLKNNRKKILNSQKLKMYNYAKIYGVENIALKIMNEVLDNVPENKEKPSNKTIKPPYEEKKNKEFEIPEILIHNLLTSVNSKLELYGMKLMYVEILLKSFNVKKDIDTLKIYLSLPKESINGIKNVNSRMKSKTNKLIRELQYIGATDNVMKEAIKLFFSNPETLNFPPNVFTYDIQAIKKHSSVKGNKPDNALITENDLPQLDSITKEKNYESDEVAIQLNENSIFFEIDTVGNKVFKLNGQSLTYSAESKKKVIFKCEDQKVQISFIDDQISISTENCEFDISIRKLKPLDFQDDVTQTEIIS